MDPGGWRKSSDVRGGLSEDQMFRHGQAKWWANESFSGMGGESTSRVSGVSCSCGGSCQGGPRRVSGDVRSGQVWDSEGAELSMSA